MLKPRKHRAKSTHPTRQRLLDAANQLLEDYAPEDVTAEMILEVSGVSSGSLYHHFRDRSDVVETVLCRRFSETIEKSAQYMQDAVDASANGRALQEKMNGLVMLTLSEAGEKARLDRARLIVLSRSSERLTEMLSLEQARLNQEGVKLIEAAVQKGLIKPKFDHGAISVFIQAYFFGKLIDDLAAHKCRDEDWIEVATETLNFLLRFDLNE